MLELFAKIISALNPVAFTSPEEMSGESRKRGERLLRVTTTAAAIGIAPESPINDRLVLQLMVDFSNGRFGDSADFKIALKELSAPMRGYLASGCNRFVRTSAFFHFNQIWKTR